jgi:hypothetical protein
MPNFEEINQSGVARVVHSLDKKKKEEALTGQRKMPNKVSELRKVKPV